MKEEVEQKTPRLSPLMIVVLFIAVVVLGVVIFTEYQSREALRAQQQKAEQTFGPALEALEAGRGAPEKSYDIDKTVRVIHSVDKALENTDSLEEYLDYMARQDYRGVAPDVLAARKRILDILLRLYAKQTELENQEETFTATRTILSAMSLVEADLSVTSGAVPALDREQAKKVLTDLRKDQEERKKLMNELGEIEAELIDAMAGYSEVYYKYVAEWDRLSTLRDRAYLAVAERNWSAALEASRAAAEMAPNETEAHLIEGLALIQLADTDIDEKNYLRDAKRQLSAYVEKHPERTAPALLLLGVANERMGNQAEATLNFQQAAAYYPKQADRLTDMLDPYRVRSFLRKSKEGNLILEQYQSTMLGAGFFSPDLQLARAHFDADEVDEGRKKILDHFSRRRNQAQWNLILSDIEFCERHLSPHFDRILVEDSHLRLLVSPTLLGSKLDVAIQNGSKRELYNATLLLAIRFTDMHREDWEVLKVGETVPKVQANGETDFGTTEIAQDVLDAEKTVDDIVAHRAILVSDDAVVWVDTDEYKLALAREMRDRVSKDDGVAKDRETWFDKMGVTPEDFEKKISASKVQVDLSIGKDDLLVKLPRELALLNPVFRLDLGGDGTGESPTVNRLTEDQIELEFGSIANLEASDAPGKANVILNSTLGNFEIQIDLAGRKIDGVRYLGNP